MRSKGRGPRWKALRLQALDRDGWACVRLDGSAAEDVLARLVPVDLRGSVFKRGHTARAQLKAIFSKTGVSRQAELVRLVLKSVASLG